MLATKKMVSKVSETEEKRHKNIRDFVKSTQATFCCLLRKYVV